MRNIRGFTLIELIVVIVILGILAATALPKFINLKDDAEKAAMESVVGAITTARALWVAKAAVCGVDYSTSLFSFIHLDSSPSVAPTCDFLHGITIGGGNPLGLSFGTIDMHPIKQSLFRDPGENWGLDGDPTGEWLIFTSKTGRVIRIKRSNDTDAITWTANPPY